MPSELFTGVSPSRHELGELALDLLALPHVVATGEPDCGVDEYAQNQPGQGDRTDMKAQRGWHEKEQEREKEEWVKKTRQAISSVASPSGDETLEELARPFGCCAFAERRSRSAELMAPQETTTMSLR